MVDTFWDLPHTRALIQEYARVCPEPARRVVNTHENGDHCWGNQLFEGAEIIAQRLCAEAMGRSESPAAMQAIAAQTGSEDPAVAGLARRLADWDFSGIEITPPTTTFEERLELDLDGVPVHLIHVGPAHTAGDLIVHLPEQGVVFAGDILFRLCTPIGWAGTSAGWGRALDRIVELAPEVVVPGHGPLCGVEGPREMKAYLEYVRAESKAHFEAGRPAHGARALMALLELAQPALPAAARVAHACGRWPRRAPIRRGRPCPAPRPAACRCARATRPRAGGRPRRGSGDPGEP